MIPRLNRFAAAFAFTFAFCAAALAQGDRAKADSLYREGKFEQAIPLYAALVQEEPQNPWLHYNLGNGYFKTNRLGRAIVSYQRAYRLLPRDSDIRYNLSLALKRSGQTLTPVGIPDALYTVYNFLSRTELTGLFWIFLWLACLSGAFIAIAKEPPSALRKLLALSAIIAAVCGGWSLARMGSDYNNPGVAVDGVMEVRGGPGDNFAASATVPEGHIVEIIQTKEDWLEISVRADAVKGWIKKSSVEPL